MCWERAFNVQCAMCDLIETLWTDQETCALGKQNGGHGKCDAGIVVQLPKENRWLCVPCRVIFTQNRERREREYEDRLELEEDLPDDEEETEEEAEARKLLQSLKYISP